MLSQNGISCSYQPKCDSRVAQTHSTAAGILIVKVVLKEFTKCQL